MVRFGIPGQNTDPLAYGDSRLSTVPVVHAPRRPTTTDKKYPLWCEWRVNKDAISPAAEGEFWKLVRFESNGDATWSQFMASGVSAGVADINDQVNTGVTPDPVTFIIDMDGSVVSNGGNPSGIPFETVSDPATHTLDLQIQLGTTVTPTPGNSNSAGLLSANTNHFTVDATSGMLSLKGGGSTPAFVSIDVDTNTNPGTDPVVANGSGVITMSGSTVANATNTNAPIATHSRAANAFNIEIQVAADRTGAPANAFDAGICSFDDTQFIVDANGFVQLLASGNGVLTNAGDDSVAVSPDGAGQFNWIGNTVANAANTKPLYIKDSATANALDIDLQVGTAITGAPLDKNDAGIVSFDDTQFTVNSDGFVQLLGTGVGQTLTADSGGALSPTAGNWNILGGTGITTSGAGSTVTVTLDTPVAETNGGTGQSTYTTGDILYSSAANTLSKLSIGSSGQVLTVSGGGVPTWAASGGGGGGGWVLISTQTASSSSSLDFTSGIDSTYDTYVFVFNRIVPATNGVEFGMRTSTDGGSSYDSGSNYIGTGQGMIYSGTSINIGDIGTYYRISGNQTNDLSNNSDYGLCGYLYLYSPSDTWFTFWDHKSVYRNTSGPLNYRNMVGGRSTGVSAVQIDAIRFLMSSGNISSGTIRLYGIAKS